MHTQEEISEWERINFDKISKWSAEWDVNPGHKVITFYLKDSEFTKEYIGAIFTLKLEEQ